MAQDPRRKREPHDGSASNNIDFVNFHGVTTDPDSNPYVDNPVVNDPLASYYRNNFEMLNRDPWIGSLVDRF